jgi:lipopolysaccharide transport system permease protein
MFFSGDQNYVGNVTVIERRSGWQLINLRELIEARDLFYFLVRREIKSTYAQTILGFLWAILQPLIQIVLFSFIFGRVANIQTGGIPYVLFSSVGIVPWTYISTAMTRSSQSLVMGQQMLGKVYFPRLVFPLVPVISRLMDFAISIIIIICVGIYYRVVPTWNILLFPLLVLLMMAQVAGVGMWLSAMAVRFRDVNHAMSFGIRLLIYSAPIVYPLSAVPEKYHLVYSINPIVGSIEGFRACLLGLPIPWAVMAVGMVVSLVMLISGALYFRRMERIFVDVM